MKIKAVEKGAEIHIETCPSPIICEVDKFRICQVLENVIMNAVKHMSPGGEIRAGVAVADGGTVRIFIADNGCGIVKKSCSIFLTGTLNQRRTALMMSPQALACAMPGK